MKLHLETKLYSGFRIQFSPPDEVQMRMDKLIESVQKLTPIVEWAAMEEWLIDDSLRHYRPIDLIMFGLQQGELLIHVVHGTVAAYIAFTNIEHQRHAMFEGWGHPELRQSFAGKKILRNFAHEAIDYAFAPFAPLANGGGLGLIKLKAEIATPNVKAIASTKSWGFTEAGQLHYEGLFHSKPVDMLLLELYSPQLLRAQEIEQIAKDTQAADVYASAPIHPGTTSSDAAQSGRGDTTSVQPVADHQPGKRNRGKRRRVKPPQELAIAGQPARPRRTSTL